MSTPRFTWEGKHRPGGLACCTLLGPEGPERDAFGCSGLYLWTFSCWQNRYGGRRGGYRPYFENYTVDASILDSDPSGFRIIMIQRDDAGLPVCLRWVIN